MDSVLAKITGRRMIQLYILYSFITENLVHFHQFDLSELHVNPIDLCSPLDSLKNEEQEIYNNPKFFNLNQG